MAVCGLRSPHSVIVLLGALLGALSLGLATQSRAEETDQAIFDLDLEDIVELEITSVSKRAERASEAAAAVHVVTGEDIRRSGARSLAEALRGVPGLHVALNSGNRWAVAARGFGSIQQDKLLVLVDGRSVYSSLLANVYWDVQDTLLEDVDRIEVIRGPGGTLWGSNAVNGVINILTKPTEASQGTYLNAGGGFVDQAFAEARRGGTVGELGHFRLYGKYARRSSLEDNGATPADDPSDQVRGGFRSDLAVGSETDLMLQGELYHGHSQTPTLLPDEITLLPVLGRVDGDVLGGHMLARLSRQLGSHSEAYVQLYYDVTDRDDTYLDYHLQTYDLELQHRFRLLDLADLTWGAGYRLNRDDFDGTLYTRLDPERESFDLLSGFAQFDRRLFDEKLRLTLGTKLERNDFSGLEHQPNLRIAFVPGPKLTLWSAVSRVVRTPHRVAPDGLGLIFGFLPPVVPLPTESRKILADDVRSEDLVAYEMGVRAQLSERIWLDLAGYYHRYDNVSTFENGPLLCTDGTPITGGASIAACTGGGNRGLLQIQYQNRAEAESKGLEAFLRLRISDDWQADLSYSYSHLRVDIDGDSNSTLTLRLEEESPEHQIGLRSRMNLGSDWTLDTGLFWVDELRGLDVDAYVRLDLRLGWKATDRIEVALVGQNLIEEHEELAGQIYYPSTRVPRSAFVTLTWRH